MQRRSAQVERDDQNGYILHISMPLQEKYFYAERKVQAAMSKQVSACIHLFCLLVVQCYKDKTEGTECVLYHWNTLYIYNCTHGVHSLVS